MCEYACVIVRACECACACVRVWVCMCVCMCVHHGGRFGPSAQLPSRQGGLAGDSDISVSTLWPLCPPLRGSMKPSSPPEAVLFPRRCGAGRSHCGETRLQCTVVSVAFPIDVCVPYSVKDLSTPFHCLKGDFPTFHLTVWFGAGLGWGWFALVCVQKVDQEICHCR